MIIIKLIGGLGNQMFQYALGRNLSIKNNVPLKLDISGFEKYTLREYELGIFNISGEFASPEEVDSFLDPKGIKKIQKNIFDFIYPYYKRPYIIEKSFSYDPNMLKIVDNAYLEGHWASEKYFKDVEDIIKSDFLIKDTTDKTYEYFAHEITNSESVSIHFRRGDYVTDPETNQVHGICPLEYYYKAIEDIANYLSNPQFYIFSNDPEWVKQNFSIPYPMKIISKKESENKIEDIHLMSLCKHHIIANSTYSWWGAWLCTNVNKRVYSPKKWYNVDYDIKDLLPESWIKL